MAAAVKGKSDCFSIKESSGEYLLIGSIPEQLDSSDLRAFFSQYVERDAFVCFHYRHRPEMFRLRPQERAEERSVAREGQILNKGSISKPTQANTCCCVVKIRPELAGEFIRYFHGKHWATPGRTLREKVRVTRMVLKEETPSVKGCDVEKCPMSEGLLEVEGGRGSSSTADCGDQAPSPEKMDITSIIELNPPALMPQGNVGTPTATFMHLINSCRLPTKVIRKLKLEFPKSRTKRRYGAVPLNYGTGDTLETGDPRTEGGTAGEVGWEGRRAHMPKGSEGRVGAVDPPQEGEEDVPSDDDRDAEEWERYEAFHNDVDKQERTRERLFEEEMEVVWEKGGSGLVFYTDASFWKEQEGECDETDEWDLDVSGYYNVGGGDKDARDLQDMALESQLRRGEEVTHPRDVGGFERHTKGIGRRVLQSSGWHVGQGLGLGGDGITEPVEAVGQEPTDKKGFGYHGQRISRDPAVLAAKRRKGEREVIISTMYDNTPEEADTLLRKAPTTTLKYRPRMDFSRGGTLEGSSQP